MPIKLGQHLGETMCTGRQAGAGWRLVTLFCEGNQRPILSRIIELTTKLFILK